MREIERKEPIIQTVIDSDCDISDDEYWNLFYLLSKT
jgi:hypothetical protein